MYGSGFELSPASISFLASLPTSYRFEVDGIRVVIDGLPVQVPWWNVNERLH